MDSIEFMIYLAIRRRGGNDAFTLLSLGGLIALSLIGDWPCWPLQTHGMALAFPSRRLRACTKQPRCSRVGPVSGIPS
ncbi:MAG: hypothetical protein ACLT1W_12345 [Alistipes onderdonkii]